MSDFDSKMNELRRDVGKKLKKWDEKIVVGYNGTPEPERKEGDVWTDHNGRKWTVKDGIRQSISRLQEARTPWFCPKCEKVMNHRFDDKCYNKHGFCYDCTIKHHTEMMKNGTFENWDKTRRRNNEKSFLKDKIQEHKDYIRTFKVPQVHFENGGWEELASINQFKDLFDKLREDIAFCENRLKEIEAEELAEQQTVETDAP